MRRKTWQRQKKNQIKTKLKKVRKVSSTDETKEVHGQKGSNFIPYHAYDRRIISFQVIVTSSTEKELYKRKVPIAQVQPHISNQK